MIVTPSQLSQVAALTKFIENLLYEHKSDRGWCIAYSLSRLHLLYDRGHAGLAQITDTKPFMKEADTLVGELLHTIEMHMEDLYKGGIQPLIITVVVHPKLGRTVSAEFLLPDESLPALLTQALQHHLACVNIYNHSDTALIPAAILAKELGRILRYHDVRHTFFGRLKLRKNMEV